MIPDGSVATGHGPDRPLECKFLHWGVSTYTRADNEHSGRYLIVYLCSTRVIIVIVILIEIETSISCYN